MPKAERPLNPREERFVAELLVDDNATAAYVRAGYSPRGAAQEASKLVRRPVVAQAIATARAARAHRTQLTADRVLREIKAIALSDIGDILDFSGESVRMRPANQIPRHARRAISKVKVKRYLEGTGEAAREVEVTEFALWDKNTAIEKAMKHLGMLQPNPELHLHQHQHQATTWVVAGREIVFK